MPRKRKPPTQAQPMLAMHADLCIVRQSATAIDDVIVQCPHCGEVSEYQDCDVIGADEDCCFCPCCQGEMRWPE